MKHIYPFVFAFLFGTNISAQNKLFTVQDVELGVRRELAVANLYNLQWRGESADFTYVQGNALFQQSANSSQAVQLLSVAELNSILINYDTLKYFPAITWENEHEFHFFIGTTWVAVNLSDKKILAYIKLPNEAANFQIFYAKKAIAYTLQNNVFIATPNSPAIAVTTDRNSDIVNGDIVSRNEFGITKGLFWSPNGNYLAFYRKDNRKVKDYPLVDVTTREAELKNTKYPMAGMASEHISLGVYSLANQSKILIEKDDTVSEKYLTNVCWTPDEKNIYIQVLNRAQNHMKFNSYKVLDGALDKTLFEEKNEKYVEPLFSVTFLHKSPGDFIYLSRKDGFNHAYLYNSMGKQLKQITQGNWEIAEILALSNTDELYYSSNEGNPLEQHAFKIDLKSGAKVKLTSEVGTHAVKVNTAKGFCLDTYSNTTIPRSIDVVNNSGKFVRNILTAANPLSKFNMPEMTIGTIKSADAVTDLYYRLIKPVNFDPQKKYPVIIYVYGGPHTQLVTNRWLGGARLWEYMMAQKGYVVFTVDNRGSSGRGLAFENVIHRQCGQNEMLDQMEGVKFLKHLSYTDTTRIGVHGWSYGGFMTTSLMVNYPNTFKVGVVGGPVIDWKYYEVMYGERYMDTPQENPEGYEETALPLKAINLQGNLLIIHGAVDPTVVWQNSLVFIQECVKNNIPVDYFVYPLSEHNVRGAERVHLMQKITDYFDRNL